MFIALGQVLVRRARLVVVLSLLSLVAVLAALVLVTPDLSSDGFVPDDAESAMVARELGETYGLGTDALVFLFDADGPVDDPAVQAAVDAALAPLAGDDRFVMVLTAWETGNPSMISNDGRSTYAVAMLQPERWLETAESDAVVAAVRAEAEAAGLTVGAGGLPAIDSAIAHQVEEDLIRAEIVSIPLTIIILLIVFGSAVAAGVPLLVGALAILAALAVLFVLSVMGFQSIFAVNLLTMLGLGLGIDYSLFMVTRFREELTRRPVEDAVVTTVATVGKAIFFAGVTVIFGLSATQFFPLPALQSMGQAGMIVTAAAMIYGLTFLPALLMLLGPRINALKVRRRAIGNADQESALWRRVATVVMRRPVVVLTSVLVVLLVVSIPVLNIDLTPGGPESLPAGSEVRIVTDRLDTDFPSDDSDRIPVLLTVAGGDALTPEGIAALQGVIGAIGGMDGITRIESPFTTQLTEAAGFDWAAWGGDPAALPAPIAGAVEEAVRGDTVLTQVSHNLSGQELEQLVRDIRALDPTGVDLAVGGIAAASAESVDGIIDNVVPALLFVLVGAYVILLFTFGSVFLPLKAMFMALLSISASLGVVVFVFQDGNFQELLGFTATGEIEAVVPVLMFCILFGLSMDYEVLMLSRIQEEYRLTGDNRASVAAGLSRTGRVITGAAAIMVVVFGGFVLAEITIIKSIGFGLALAVLLDATVVRGLLVPATMRLMGDWNWWAPAPVRTLVGRLGLSHHDEQPATMPTRPVDV